jgi:hypothetical protein
MRRRLAALTAATVLAGCTEPPNYGKVVEHKYTAGWVQYIPGEPGTPGSCSSSKPPVCTPGTPPTPPETIYWPANWALRLDDRKGNVGDRDVSEEEYDRCRDGDTYPDCARGR